MRGAKPVALVCALIAAALIVLSIINRDSGELLLMPFAFYAGMLLFLVATFLLTYSPEEAQKARERRDAEEAEEARRSNEPS